MHGAGGMGRSEPAGSHGLHSPYRGVLDDFPVPTRQRKRNIVATRLSRVRTAVTAVPLPDPATPPLVAVPPRFTGRTIEEALRAFEDACSEENFHSVVIEECLERPDGVLVRYQVRWKVSVFDDHAYGSHVSWALLTAAAPGAGNSADARFCVAAATAERHIK